MKKKIYFWVEGIADQKFLADVMNKWFSFGLSSTKKETKVFSFESEEHKIQILLLGSVSAVTSKKDWENNRAKDFEDNSINAVKNIVIIDADKDFHARIKEVTQTIINVGFEVESDLYLWPTNQPESWPDNPNDDKNSDLERLLIQITNEDYKDVLTCFDQYESCLRSDPEKNYITPNRKAKIYAYIEALSGEGNEGKRDYTNKNWNLDHNQPALKPLYEFLEKHLKS